MNNCIDREIAKLQDNLLMIRKAGNWSAEEFGKMIGVTKQTISNLENKKTVMNKTQYIAIRAVLDFEISERSDDTSLAYIVNLCLNSDNLSKEEIKKAQAFVAGASKTGLDSATILGGLAALIGIAAAEALAIVSPTTIGSAGTWPAKILKRNK